MSEREMPILLCPHCQEYIIIEKINCGIFRHGVKMLFHSDLFQ